MYGSGMIGVGIDAVDIARFRLLLDRRGGFAERVFTEGERALVAEQVDPVASLAARFAAKEATMKSLRVGLGAFGFHDVEVHTLESGAPVLRVHAAAAALAEERGVTEWHVSLTHTRTIAQAIVMAVGSSG